MKKTKKLVGSIWRITGMEVWDVDYFDMEVAAHVTIRNDLTGEFQFGLVQGDIDARVADIGGVARVEFSWSGSDENDPMSGRGWMDVTGDQALEVKGLRAENARLIALLESHGIE